MYLFWTAFSALGINEFQGRQNSRTSISHMQVNNGICEIHVQGKDATNAQILVHIGMRHYRYLCHYHHLHQGQYLLLIYSIRRNICYGLEEEDGLTASEQPTMTQIEEAAKSANAHEFIMRLPDGYETVSVTINLLRTTRPADEKIGHWKPCLCINSYYRSGWKNKIIF